MSFQTVVMERIASITAALNAIAKNAKKIDDLPEQLTVNSLSKIHVSRDGFSEFLTIQKVKEDIINNINDQLVTVGDITVTGNTLTIPEGVQWKIGGVFYTKNTAADEILSLAAAGNSRVDIIVANAESDILRVIGPESEGEAVRPNIPSGSLLITEVTITDSAIGTPSTPVIGSGLSLKADIISPTFTGSPNAPTPEVGTSNDQIATTRFVSENSAESKYSGAGPSTVTVGGIPKDTVLTGRTPLSLWEQLLVVYLEPSFSLVPPEVTGQASIVEVGTTLSGVKTFTWGTKHDYNIKPNTIAIYDITGVAYLAQSLANDGTQSITISTLKLNSEGASQQWKAEGTNTKEVVFTSQIRTITARFIRYYGAQATSVTDSASVKALPTNEFQTANGNTFILNTGTVEKKFIAVLPPSITISQVIDLETNANITSDYILTGTVNVTDADGANRLYNVYEMNLGAPYSAIHRHQIKTI
jgi:hypothetical protein